VTLPTIPLSGDNLKQVVHKSQASLLSSTINWYQSKESK